MKKAENGYTYGDDLLSAGSERDSGVTETEIYQDNGWMAVNTTLEF